MKPAWKTKKGTFGAQRIPPPARPVRRAQLIAPFGIGSMNDFRNDEALMCAGLDNWFVTLPEQALRVPGGALAARLNREFFVRPPEFSEEAGPKSEDTPRPISIVALLSPMLQDEEDDALRRTAGMRREDLSKKNPARATHDPGAHRDCLRVGHIEDFPFRKWIGCTCASDVDAEMFFKAGRSAASLAGIKIECTKCKQKRSLAGAFEGRILDGGERDLFGGATVARTRSRIEFCGVGLQTVQRGSSNVYFPAVQSSIYIPPAQAAENEEIRRVLDTPANWIGISSGTIDGKVNPQVVAAFAAMMEWTRPPSQPRRRHGSTDRRVSGSRSRKRNSDGRNTMCCATPLPTQRTSSSSNGAAARTTGGSAITCGRWVSSGSFVRRASSPAFRGSCRSRT